MNTFVTRCDTIRTATGATMLVVHHFGKDESKGMRGSVALKAAADTVIEVTGIDGVRTARVEKQKDGATGETFTFTLRPIDLGPDGDGETMLCRHPERCPTGEEAGEAKAVAARVSEGPRLPRRHHRRPW
jgi:hypothetical protein